MAVFTPVPEGGYEVRFPDLPGCFSQGDSLEEAMTMAKDALELHLWGMENDNDPIPPATLPENIELKKGCFTVPVSVYMPPVREEMDNKTIKKTLTIPAWLNRVSEEADINFSQTLQKALKQQLGIQD
jgi:predicted RNase H-like HicB family nuclease